MSHAVVVGGGVGGLAAARQLAMADWRVTLFEAAPRVGGLATGFELSGHAVERYYHHLFPTEDRIVELLGELGLGEAIGWFPSTMNVLVGGRSWPFTTPVDLLRFAPLSMPDRIRAGVGALRLGRVKDWESLDEIPATTWLRSLTSQGVNDVVWSPLLRFKFGSQDRHVPAAWMWGRLQQRRGARRHGGKENLGYLRGSFGRMFDALAEDLRRRGVEIRTSTGVERIVVQEDRVRGVEGPDGFTEADAVLFTGPLPRLAALVPSELADLRWTEARGLGAVVVVLDLPAPLTTAFWTNVVDPSVPFGAIIELTNLAPPAWFGGRSIVYLGRYFTEDEEVATRDLEHLSREWVEALAQLFPAFSPQNIGERHAFRTAYAAPLVTTPYLDRIPPVKSHIAGLYVATTAQIYPQDRGMDEGIRRGEAAARAMLGEGWVCPICGETASSPRWEVDASGSETGVSAEAFRPSSGRFGQPVASVVTCNRCGHGSLARIPSDTVVKAAYEHAVDPVSLREEAGQVRTARRDLGRIERFVSPGPLLDVGCWTGSFLVAARERGWAPVGIEPSAWAVERARARGLDVLHTTLGEADLSGQRFRAAVACDVLEHLDQPRLALAKIAQLLEPAGALWVTVPDAGSPLARAMGRRWWSVLPMHLQYFTRDTLGRLLGSCGFRVGWMGTHPKAFSARYYGERVSEFNRTAGRVVGGALAKTALGDRLVAPDFFDRMAVLALRR